MLKKGILMKISAERKFSYHKAKERRSERTIVLGGRNSGSYLHINFIANKAFQWPKAGWTHFVWCRNFSWTFFSASPNLAKQSAPYHNKQSATLIDLGTSWLLTRKIVTVYNLEANSRRQASYRLQRFSFDKGKKNF
jgi:hypothetical protein